MSDTCVNWKPFLADETNFCLSRRAWTLPIEPAWRCLFLVSNVLRETRWSTSVYFKLFARVASFIISATLTLISVLKQKHASKSILSDALYLNCRSFSKIFLHRIVRVNRRYKKKSLIIKKKRTNHTDPIVTSPRIEWGFMIKWRKTWSDSNWDSLTQKRKSVETVI